jgi:hypothetical protein
MKVQEKHKTSLALKLFFGGKHPFAKNMDIRYEQKCRLTFFKKRLSHGAVTLFCIYLELIPSAYSFI